MTLFHLERYSYIFMCILVDQESRTWWIPVSDRAMNGPSGQSFFSGDCQCLDKIKSTTFLGTGHETTATSLTYKLDIGLKSKLIKFSFHSLFVFMRRLWQSLSPITQSSNTVDPPKLLPVFADTQLPNI